MNKNAIKVVLAENGILHVATARKVAEVLKLSVRTITQAKLKGQLKQIDRNTYDVESIVDWLFAHPRYMTKING